MNLFRFFNCFGKSNAVSVEVPKSSQEIFIEKQQAKFAAIPDTPQSNANIESVFYDKTAYTKALSNVDNDIEKHWRSNIMHSTQYGPVFMHYDAYKQGFSYYSDSALSHSVLDAIAVDYVIKFRCRDFFIQEKYYPENVKNILMDTHFPVENKQKAKVMDGPFYKRQAKKGTTENPLSDAKKKPKSKKVLAQEKAEEERRLKAEEKIKQQREDAKKRKNKFIHLGIIRNMELLQKPVKKGFKKDMSDFKCNWSAYKAQFALRPPSPPSSD